MIWFHLTNFSEQLIDTTELIQQLVSNKSLLDSENGLNDISETVPVNETILTKWTEWPNGTILSKPISQIEKPLSQKSDSIVNHTIVVIEALVC